MKSDSTETGRSAYILSGIVLPVLFYSAVPAFLFVAGDPSRTACAAFYAILAVLTAGSFAYMFGISEGSAFFGVPYFAVSIAFSFALLAGTDEPVINNGAFVLSLVNGVLLIFQTVSETRKYLGAVRDRDDKEK